MAGYAALVIGTAMAAITACRIKFAFNPVQRHEVPAMRHLPVRPIPVLCRGFYFYFAGMAIITE